MAYQTQAKFCGECGTELARAAKFCSDCGIELATFESFATGETSGPADTTTVTPTPSIEPQTPNSTSSRQSPRWPFSRRITKLLVLLIVSAAVISLAISFWNQSSITFATNFNIGDRDTAGRFSRPLAGGRVFTKDVHRIELIKRRHQSGLPIRCHIKSKRDQSAVVHVGRLSKHQWGHSRQQHRHFQRSQTGIVVPHW